MHSRSSRILVNFGPLFWEHKFSTADMLHTSCRSVTKLGSIIGLANDNQHLFPIFGELRFRGPAISRGDTHQSFTDALSKFRLRMLRKPANEDSKQLHHTSV